MKKGISIILVVVAILIVLLLVLIIAGRIYFYGALIGSVKQGSPIYLNEEATKDWQTYTDSDLNISFKYPPGWQTYKEGSNLIYLHTYTGPGKPYDPANDQGQFLVVIDNAARPGSKNADELVQMKKMPVNRTLGGIYYYKNQKEFKVNNYDAFYVEQTNKEHTTALGETYLLDGKGGGVIFSARPKDGVQAYLSDIMSTVKFTTKSESLSSGTNDKVNSNNINSNNIKKAATSVTSCITSQLGKGEPISKIYSTETGGCGDKDYLVQNNLLEEKQTNGSTVHFLNNSNFTKICLYTENSSGNGIISWDSESGIITEPGKSNSTSNCI